MIDLRLSARRHAGVEVVEVGGELDAVTKAQLDRFLTAYFNGPDERVVLDLSGVTFMDSGSLGLIVDHYKRADAAGGRLALAGVSPSRMQVLWLTGLADWLPLYADVDAALLALARPPGSAAGLG
ncbi:STAS domain-containing protein [Actinomadura sp. ATCC 31491]|uniref:Anti-sigma factor antagonist n=1 Tax=Actinomadura luzonensis TaxID=2805427 RepID=A0ABT0FUH1_9ACTN|nr:STAS domain-containing protein [Actinomadura luzonensis]MCK2215548.1 STAS domain-containing protein [Actinomadura luzonensis]